MPPKKHRQKPFSWAKGNGRLTDFTRGVLYGLHLKGDSVPTIAELLDMTPTGVRESIKATELQLGVRVPPEPDPGDEPETVRKRLELTPKQLEVDERREVIDELMYDKEEGKYRIHTARDVRRQLFADASPFKCISLRTIQRDLEALGHHWKAMPKVPFMTDKHVKNRLAMADDLLSIDCENILFSDESYFDCNIRHRSAYQRDGEPQQMRPVERYTSKVMVWGVIGVGFSLLVFLNDTVNAESYVSTLKQFLLPRIDTERHIFMQDNARPHTSEVTRKFFQESDITLLEWPAKSPDLNPIETVWGMMKSKIDVDLCADVEQLENAVTSAWNNISQDKIDSLVRGFPERVRKMVHQKGLPTNVSRCYL